MAKGGRLRIQGALTTSVIALSGLLSTSCSMFSAVQENIELVNTFQEGLEEAEKTQPGVKFVTVENAWFCLTKEAAESRKACPGGALLEVNELIDTVGPMSQGNGWKVIYLDDTQPQGDGWVRADALGNSPVLDRYRASRASFQEEFAPEVRMLPDDRSSERFLNPDTSQATKVWLDSVSREFVLDLTYASDGLSFWLPTQGAGRSGVEVFFFLRSERYAQRMRRHRYACNESYCDEFSFVARLKDYRYKPDDRPGPAEGFPVMEIVRFADRLDEYRVE